MRRTCGSDSNDARELGLPKAAHRRIGFEADGAPVGFGVHKRNRLFLAGSTSMYSMYVNAVGANTV